MPSRTWERSPPRVRREKVSGTRVSRLTLMRVRPAAARRAATGASLTAFVVSARSVTPGMRPRASTSSGKFRRAVGSPPVRRMWVTPRPAKTPTSRSISSKVRTSLRGIQSMPSAGMQ